jgi:hypothetical protein
LEIVVVTVTVWGAPPEPVVATALVDVEVVVAAAGVVEDTEVVGAESNRAPQTSLFWLGAPIPFFK